MLKNKIDLKLENYYTIFYDESWYLGRIVDFWDVDKTKIKFMKNELEKFIWPKNEDIHIIENQFIFYGPIQLQGNYPFTIK